MKIKLKNVRLSYPFLFKVNSFNGSEGKYSAEFIFDKEQDKDQIEQIKKIVLELCQEKFKSKLSADKICFKDGDLTEREDLKGKYFLRASNRNRPLVLNKDRHPLAEEDAVIYAGCYVNAIVSLWCQDNNYGKRINATLDGVQFAKDGEPFASKAATSVNDFDVVAEETTTLEEDFL